MSPSKYRTVSTMCSSTRGRPTAPLYHVAHQHHGAAAGFGYASGGGAFALAPPEPGAELSWSEKQGLDESMTQNDGLFGFQCGQDIFQLDFSLHAYSQGAVQPRRRARRATCAPVSSPVTYSTGI